MKLKHFLTLSHVVTAGTGAIVAMIAALFSSSAVIAGVLAVGLGTFVGLVVNRVLASGLRLIQTADQSGTDAPVESHPIREIEIVKEHVRKRAARWSDMGSSARHQTQEIESLIEQMYAEMDEDASNRSGSAASQLKRTLRHLTTRLQSELDQIIKHAGDVQGNTAVMTAVADEQAESVNRTTTYVEQLSVQFDTIAENANAAQSTVRSGGEVAFQAHSMVSDHLSHIEATGRRIAATERKLQTLSERTLTIETILETITEISAKTDLLALNASIESLRAGEEGRGFSVVAEEVRKLAEQITESTRQVSELVETIHIETDESVQALSGQRKEMQDEIQRMTSTSSQIDVIRDTCRESAEHLQHLSRTAAQQLHLTQDLVMAVERISDSTRKSRTHAEGAGWAARSLNQHLETLDRTLAPLRSGLQIERTLNLRHIPAESADDFSLTDEFLRPVVSDMSEVH